MVLEHNKLCSKLAKACLHISPKKFQVRTAPQNLKPKHLKSYGTNEAVIIQNNAHPSVANTHCGKDMPILSAQKRAFYQLLAVTSTLMMSKITSKW